MIVGVVGLGKLGLPFALTFARGGAQVHVYDTNEMVRDAVFNRNAHIDEPQVADLLERYHLFMSTPEEIGQKAHIIFVVVPTPSNDDGSFTDRFVRDAIESLPTNPPPTEPHGDVTDDIDADHVVAIVSTVSPGAFTGPNSLQKLARSRGYNLVYTPTLIALGSVVDNLVYADVQIIGGEEPDDEPVWLARRAFRIITQAPVVRMTYESAAIAKLASNVFVTMKIGFINTVAQLCDQFDADVNTVTYALGKNERIGPKALTAGAGYGGPCFPRDAAAFAEVGERVDVTAAMRLGNMVQWLNGVHLQYVIRRIAETTATAGDTFAVLGREYKDGSPYQIESWGDRLAQTLDRYFVKVSHFEDADIVVVAQPLRDMDLSNVKHGATVYDLWRTHAELRDRTDVTYVALGRGKGEA